MYPILCTAGFYIKFHTSKYCFTKNLCLENSSTQIFLENKRHTTVIFFGENRVNYYDAERGYQVFSCECKYYLIHLNKCFWAPWNRLDQCYFSFFPFQPKKVRLFWFIFTVHHLINKLVYIFNLTIWFIKTIFSIFLTKVVLMHVPQRWRSQQCWLVAIKLKPVWLGSFCVEFTGCMFSLTAPRHTKLTDIILKQLYKDG